MVGLTYLVPVSVFGATHFFVFRSWTSFLSVLIELNECR